MKKEEEEDKTHDSYGMISISRFSGGGSQFFGSDIVQDGGVSITISKASVQRKLHGEWFHSGDDLIRIEMSSNQYVDAITSGMDTQGVPCTISRLNGAGVPRIEHVIDKKEVFKSEMKDTQEEFKSRIDDTISLLEGNVGKRKKEDVIHSLQVLKSHISSNTNFVLTCFDEAMEKTVTEAKQSVSNYIEHKVHSLGIEGMKKQLDVSITNNEIEQ